MPQLRGRLLELRSLVVATARATEGVGEIEETLITDPLPTHAISDCLAAALTYHRDKRRKT